MIARRSVWSDPDVQELVRRFVPVADEVHRLQRGQDCECRVFQGFAEQGHYKDRTEPSDTRQGIYAVAPDGTFLASINSHNPDRMLGMLERALARWEEKRDETAQIDDATARELRAARRARERAPKDGLILEVFARDLPREDMPATVRNDWRAHAWNKDYAWFQQDEARLLVSGRTALAPPLVVDPKLVRKLAQFWLVDHVRGQTSHFPDGAVERAILTSKIERRDGDRVHLRLRGESHTRERGRWRIGAFRKQPSAQERGVSVELLGRATWDAAGQRFVAFEMVALGERWGGTRYNGRDDDLGRSGIGFAFVLTDRTDVAPAFSNALR